MMTNPVPRESDIVTKGLPGRALVRAFAMGISAPSLFVLGSSTQIASLRQGESISHGWSSVGYHLSRSVRRFANVRQPRRGTDRA